MVPSETSSPGFFEPRGGSTGSSRAFSRPTVIRFVVSRLFAQAGSEMGRRDRFQPSLSRCHGLGRKETDASIEVRELKLPSL